MSPCTMTLFLNAAFISPLILILLSIGARTTFLASFAWAFLTVTSSPIEAPEFLRVVPSILTTRFTSDCEVKATAAVFLFPEISIRSPSLRPNSDIDSGSSLAIFFPTSFWDNDSATLI